MEQQWVNQQGRFNQKYICDCLEYDESKHITYMVIQLLLCFFLLKSSFLPVIYFTFLGFKSLVAI